ncbi:RagB/SusD family nutrient uptake outer membrane protein [Maribellus comscasis]|uniref:RagB/SusD family nutrient uptake outer membrane protein n=1 Tax=Maribellus comscasis TaxID=2681766 RepID=A0A6I6JXZ4_9BACT|nr:RagB/SusD family nutrient uptake outer membrane protein [Maribellus comscasis]QGY47421.1 RagB/SusD family nutrient uptake outer membrane protein [Maribellus comscasis]
MKKINYITIVLLSLFIFSCTELDEIPVTDISPEGYFKDVATVEAAVLGTYGYIASEGYWGRKYTLTIMLRADMTDIGERGTPARRQQINDFGVDATNGMITAIWPRSYEIISAANYAIAGAESLTDADADQTALMQLTAEARLVRAFIYFNLVRMFGDIPYIDYAISDPASVADISKTSEDQVYEGIIADLEFATENLPVTPPDNSRSRPSKGTAYTILADVYLTLGNFQEAYNHAKWVIDNEAELDYDLESDYQDLFDATKQDATKEHIFSFDFLGSQSGSGSTNDDLTGALTGVRGADVQGWSVAVPSLDVYNTWDDRDYRKKVAFADSTLINGVLQPYTVYSTVKRPHIAKYFEKPGNSNGEARYSDHNYAAYRYGEVLLTAAEALNEVSGPTDEALGYVNRIRERARNWAGTTVDFPADVQTGISKDEFRNLVLEERRLELSFEFKRWYDIQRRDLGEEAFTGTNSLEPHSNFDSSRDYLLPIPQDELDRNPNLLPQNSGY